jgi:flagellar motor protein MotB
MAIDYSYLDDAASQVAPIEETNNADMVNVTIRIDADCFLLCDGEFTEIELKAGKLSKVQLPVGQHLLEFVDLENSDLKMEQIVDWPELGKSYLVLVDGLEELIADYQAKKAKADAERKVKEEAERKAKEEAAKKEAERKAKEEAIRKAKARQDITYTLSITGVQNRLQAMITLRALYGCGAADSKQKFAKLPVDIATTKSKNDALEKLKKLNAGGVVANVIAVNALGEIIDLKK